MRMIGDPIRCLLIKCNKPILGNIHTGNVATHCSCI